jgi:hypothetical protein
MIGNGEKGTSLFVANKLWLSTQTKIGHSRRLLPANCETLVVPVKKFRIEIFLKKYRPWVPYPNKLRSNIT